MKLGVLYSGGKDSTLALMKAQKYHDVVCLITVVSENKESFMFHTPNIDVTLLQSQSMGIPLVRVVSKGEKEIELGDLKKAIQEAVQRFKIEGVVSGALRSTYQASRVQRICHELNLWCFNPLWLLDQVELLYELLEKEIHAVISGVFAEPLDESYLGKEIDKVMIEKLSKQQNPAGEGGEIETTVLDAPIFKKRIMITDSKIDYARFAGTFTILDAKLEDK